MVEASRSTEVIDDARLRKARRASSFARGVAGGEACGVEAGVAGVEEAEVGVLVVVTSASGPRAEAFKACGEDTA